MIKIIYFLFSADHEIFFGENYKTEKELLIDSTYRLMNILEKYKIPLTLMTDVCSILKYREVGLNEFPMLMDEQLIYAIRNNHDVQLHLHPHWINSKYVNGKWKFDSGMYKLHDFGFYKSSKEITANAIIKNGKEYIEKLLKPIQDDYKCIAFRAGGWCLQPEKELIRSLLDNKIYIDTSIFKGGYANTETHYLNYKDLPKEINWFIDSEKGLNRKSNKGIYEIPIGTITNKKNIYYQKIKNKVNRKKYLKISMNGTAINYKKMSFIQKVYSKINNFVTEPIMLSYDTATSIELINFIEYYLNALDYKNNDYYISIIGHPKVLNNSNFNEIEKFCIEISAKYYGCIKFINYQEAYDKVFNNQN